MRFLKNMHFLLLFFMLLQEKQKMEKAKKTYKNSVFFKVVIQNEKNENNGFFSRNCLTLFVSGGEKKRAFSCTLSVLAKNVFLDQNSENQEKL